MSASHTSASTASMCGEDVARRAARSLREEVPRLRQQVDDQCTELERRLGGARLRVLQRSITARAQALTPLYRANIMHRARSLQKSRLALVQQLQQCAQSLTGGRDRGASSPKNASSEAASDQDFPNVSAVLSVAYAAMTAERAFAAYEQPLRPTQPAFCAFLAQVTAPEHALPQRLSEIKTRQAEAATLQGKKAGFSAHTDTNSTATTAAAALDEELNALVEEGLELLLDCLEARPPHSSPHPHPHGQRKPKASESPRPRANAEREDVYIIPVVILDEEGNDTGTAADDDDEGLDVVVESDSAHDEDADVQHIRSTTESTLSCPLVLRWPVLLSLEQYCMDMPEPVADAQARLQKRIAIQKSGKPLNAEAEVQLASTIGFYFTALGASDKSDKTSASSTMPAKASISLGYGGAGGDDDDESGEGGLHGSTLRLSEKEKLIAALTETILRHVDDAWDGLRVTITSPPPPAAATSADALEDVIDRVRLRYVVELVAMVMAAWSAVPLIMESDEARFYELTDTREVRLCAPPMATTATTEKVTSAADFLRATVPAKILCLPGLDHLFFCLSYCIGAALARDGARWAPPPISAASPPVNEEEEGEEDDTTQTLMWSDAFTARFLTATASATPQLATWWRVWLYVWDCVLHIGDSPTTTTTTSSTTGREANKERSVGLSRPSARRWLECVVVAWRRSALAGTALLHPLSRAHDKMDECVSLEADARQLDVPAVLQTGRTAVMAMW